MYVSKPPKFDEKRGSAYIIWDIKFKSWAGVKGISAMLTPSFDSKLLSKESNMMDIWILHRRPKEVPESKMQ
jgi:hypothetical protein